MIELGIFIGGLLVGALSMYMYSRSSGKTLHNLHFDNLLKNKLLKEELVKASRKNGFKKRKKKYYHGKKKSQS